MGEILVGEPETIELQEKIERYVRGELTGEEEDELWVEFLKEPYWYEYFNTWLHLVAIGREKAK